MFASFVLLLAFVVNKLCAETIWSAAFYWGDKEIENNTSKLILVSPRKSGTHLITTWLGQRFAFKGQLQIGTSENGLYSLGKTFHTSLAFFKALDVEDFTGGMLLPISSCLGLIICRHPADVLLSHLNFSL